MSAKIAIFVSGNGTNCENIIRYFDHRDTADVVLVVSSRSDAYAIERAKRLGVPTVVMGKQELNNSDRLMPLLRERGVSFIVLAGFLLMVPDFLIDAYDHRIVNIHPSLLPKYGGRGMWGHHVHEAVKAAGDTETGITIHYVDRQCDGGEIIFQARTSVSPDDTADDIAEHVHLLEQQYFPQIIEQTVCKQ